MRPEWMNHFEMSRNLFESTLKEPKEGDVIFPWTELQRRLNAWSNREYGYQPSMCRVLGLMEEFGELLHATDPAKMCDAIGDMSICLIQLCNTYRLDAGVLVMARDEKVTSAFSLFSGLETAKTTRASVETSSYLGTYDAQQLISRLAHLELKCFQGIRGTRDENGGENRDVMRRGVAENASELFFWLQVRLWRTAEAHPYRFQLTNPVDTLYFDVVAGTAAEVMGRTKNLLPSTVAASGSK